MDGSRNPLEKLQAEVRLERSNLLADGAWRNE